MALPLYYVWLLNSIMLYLIIIKKLKHMKEKDLKIGKKYLLKRNTSKRTWKWIDDAKLVEIEGNILTFYREFAEPFVFRVNKEEFLGGGRCKTLNNWWNKKWINYALRFKG